MGMGHAPGRGGGRGGACLEENVAGQELGEDGAQGPKVDSLAIGQPQHHLRGAVGAALHVAAQHVAGEAAAAQVDHLHLAPADPTPIASGPATMKRRGKWGCIHSRHAVFDGCSGDRAEDHVGSFSEMPCHHSQPPSQLLVHTTHATGRVLWLRTCCRTL